MIINTFYLVLNISRFKDISFLFLLIYCSAGKAQTIPVGFPVVEDYLRRSQILNEFDSTISFSIRPLNSIVINDSTLVEKNTLGKDLFKSSKFKLRLLPLQFNTEFNSHHPYGWNNGSLIRSRGFQSLFSG